MDCSKIKKIAFILLILLIVLFPFWCVRGLCAELVNPVSVTNNLVDYQNYIAQPTNELQTLYIYSLLPDNKYNLKFSPTGGGNLRGFFVYDDIPSVGDQLVNVSFIGNDYNFETPQDAKFLVFYASQGKDSVTLTRLTDEMSNTVGDLTSSVGIDNIWNVFDISINYIVIVVLFAFGCFIIFRIIRKISKGKEGL